MPTPLQEVFSATRDPLEVQRELIEQRQRGFATQRNSTQRIGYALGLALSGLNQKRKTGDRRPDELAFAQDTQAALHRGLEAAGDQREGEKPEDFAARQMSAVYDSLSAEDAGRVNPQVLQQVASARATLASDAETARYEREQRMNTLAIQDIQLADQRYAHDQRLLEGRVRWVLDKQSQQFVGVRDASNPENDAALDQLLADNPDRYIAMTREEVVALNNAELRRALSAAEVDKVTKRKLLEQGLALNRSIDIGTQMLGIMTEGGIENIDANTLAERLRGGLFDWATQIASASDIFRTASSRGTVGQVAVDTDNDGQADRIEEVESTVDRLMTTDNEWAASIREANIDRAVLNSLSRNLAYAVARANDPSGRLSDFDVEISMKIIGAALTSPQALAQTLRSVMFTSGGAVMDSLQLLRDAASSTRGAQFDPALDELSKLLTRKFDALNEAVLAVPGHTRNRVDAPVSQTGVTAPPVQTGPVPGRRSPSRYDLSGAFQ